MSAAPGRYAVVFPGQGSQAVGMGIALAQAFPEAARVLQVADEVVPGIVALMRQGPEEELRRTSHAQPALLAASLAAWVAWQARATAWPVSMAGHSLGEYTALAAASALSPRDAMELVRARGLLMEQAMPPGQGGMGAVLGMDTAAVEGICREVSELLGGPVPAVVPANYNAPGQVVVSGRLDALEAVADRVRRSGGRYTPLSVSGPFHSPYMASAAARFEGELARVPFTRPQVEVFSNVTAAPHSPSPDGMRRLLQQQLTSPVRWVEIVQAMVGLGITHVVELGPGKVLAGLIRRIAGDRVVALSAGDPASLEDALARLRRDGVA